MDPLSLVGVRALCKRIKCTGRVFRGLSNSGWEKEVSVPRASQIFWSNCLRSEGPEVGRWEWFGGFGSLLGPTSLAQLSPCLANRVPKPQPTPPSKTPKKILQAYISGENSEHNHNQNELIEIYTITYQGDSCMKGIWEVLDEGVGGSLPTHLQELLPSCKGEQILTFKETRPRRQYCCLDRKGPGPHTCLMTILTPSN